MPLTPTKLAERRERVAFPFAGETMTIEYVPAALSDESIKAMQTMSARIQALEQQLAAATENGDEAAQAAAQTEADTLNHDFAEWVSRVLVWWDYAEYVNEDGSSGPMIPLTPESIMEQSSKYGDFVNACIFAAVQDYREVKPNGVVSSVRSGATSLRTVK